MLLLSLLEAVIASLWISIVRTTEHVAFLLQGGISFFYLKDKIDEGLTETSVFENVCGGSILGVESFKT